MFLIILAGIFLRPFISSLAFDYLNSVFSAALIMFSGAYLIYRKRLFSIDKGLIYFIIPVFFTLFISLNYSQDRLVSVLELYKYAGGIFLFLFAVSLSEKERGLVIRAIILSGLIISLLAIYQYFFGFHHLLNYVLNKPASSFALDYLQNRRVFLPFVTPGILGGYLAMIIPLIINDKKRIWSIVPVFSALVLTRSLSAILSLICVLVIYSILKGKLKREKIIILAGMIILIIFIFIWRTWGQKTHMQPEFSTMMRISYWKETIGTIKAHPFAGVGPGNFNLKFSRYAHNSYLQIWAEMGIFGLISLFLLTCAAFKSGLKDLKKNVSDNQAAALMMAGSVFLIHNSLDFTFFLPEVAFIWWIILGLIAKEN